jgi:transcription elongation factor Elf1
MAKKKEGANYQHKLKCPECKKRKVYVEADDEGSLFTCKACGYSWKV